MCTSVANVHCECESIASVNKNKMEKIMENCEKNTEKKEEEKARINILR